MTAEEIGFEPPPRYRRGHGGLVVAGVVAAAVVWLLVSGNGDDSATPHPSPSPTPTQKETQPPGIEGAGFQLGQVCAPRTTSRMLTVRFTLANRSTDDLFLASVLPGLPLGGLKPRTETVRVGGCADESGPGSSYATVPAGMSALVVFTFGLPATCPQPLPVFADVASRGVNDPGPERNDSIPVYADLGDVEFATCP